MHLFYSDAIEYPAALSNRDGRTGMAVAAIDALAFYRDDSAKAEAVVDAAGSRSESEVKRAINVRFDSD